MIKENVNGIATQIKKLYENVNGVKQEIKERYELVNGRKELVFKNETIKEIQLVDSNGYPLNSTGIGRRTSMYVGGATYWGFGSDESATSSFRGIYSKNFMDLGVATNKKIISIKFGFFRVMVQNARSQSPDESPVPNPTTVNWQLRDSTGAILRSITSANTENASGITNYRYRYYGAINNFEVQINRVLNGLYYYSSLNLAGSSTYPRVITSIVKDLWVKYIE